MYHVHTSRADRSDMLPLGAITEEHFDRNFDNNFKGVLLTVQKALPLLRDNASIILSSSTTSIKGTANFSVYSASKAAHPRDPFAGIRMRARIALRVPERYSASRAFGALRGHDEHRRVFQGTIE